MLSQHLKPQVRHDFLLMFDVTNGNPNGDPDGGNMPRTDPETSHGLVTDVCLKRKIRNYVAAYAQQAAEEGDSADEGLCDRARFKIFIEHHSVLNEKIRTAYIAQNMPVGKSSQPKNRDNANKAKIWMCQNFYDVRMFGAVMSTGLNAGQVRGPMQLTFARSIDPVQPQDMAITRVAVTDSKDREKLQTMGRKTLIPYGLYIAHGFYSPYLAQQTGVNEADLALFWQALVNMWELDRSASRGLMASRGLYVFSHHSKLGNAPAHKLFETVEIARRKNITIPRQFGDYLVTVREDVLPDGITLARLTEG